MILGTFDRDRIHSDATSAPKRRIPAPSSLKTVAPRSEHTRENSQTLRGCRRILTTRSVHKEEGDCSHGVGYIKYNKKKLL